jgi:pimeloyl-ACP methyl ester carboxylesterase
MTDTRIQRASSLDGTEIAARVHGEGPPLVLIHGAFADGENGWLPLLPELTDRFSCYTMSLRGRGLSAPADDLAPERAYEDVICLVESIGEPSPVFGLSGGALFALGAAQGTDAISAVIAYEPPVFQVLDDSDMEHIMGTIAQVAKLAQAGRPADGHRAFLEIVSNDEELAGMTELDLPGLLAPNVEIELAKLAAMADRMPPSATEPDQLAKIQAPVLLLHGTRSAPAFTFVDGIRYVTEHVPQAQVRVVEGAGHLAPLFQPGPVADQIAAFLVPTAQSV